jgi:hypothetical protein
MPVAVDRNFPRNQMEVLRSPAGLGVRPLLIGYDLLLEVVKYASIDW